MKQKHWKYIPSFKLLEFNAFSVSILSMVAKMGMMIFKYNLEKKQIIILFLYTSVRTSKEINENILQTVSALLKDLIRWLYVLSIKYQWQPKKITKICHCMFDTKTFVYHSMESNDILQELPRLNVNKSDQWLKSFCRKSVQSFEIYRSFFVFLLSNIRQW